jgi:hypothetical protein
MHHFGAGRIFMDIDTIEPGEDFIETMKIALNSCSVFVAVIGENWLKISDEHSRRLDNPNNYVRLEIATALNRGIRVIPVLVDGASMPQEHDLPDDLQSLSRRNALEISDKRWSYDVQQLIKAIERTLKQPSHISNFWEKLKSSQVKRFIIGGVGIVGIFIVAIALWIKTRSIPLSNTNSPLIPTTSSVPTPDSSPPVAPTMTEVHRKQDRPKESVSSTPIATPTASPKRIEKKIEQDISPWEWIAGKARSLYPDATRIETVMKVGDPQCNNGICEQNVKVVLKDSSGGSRYDSVIVTYQRANGSWKGTAKRLN